MNKLIYIKNFFVVFLLIFSSCSKDFLEKKPTDALAEDGFFNSADRAKVGVNAIYTSLASANLYGEFINKIEDVPSGDILNSNTGNLGYNNFSIDAADPNLMSVYSGLYEGVNRSNVVIQAVPLINMDKPLQGRYVGEAKFLRAFLYWHLTTLWGDVPLFITPIKNSDDALVAKTPVADTYKVMIKDLEDAEAVLPVSYAAADLGRATKGAAQALLGKVQLYAKNYAQAEAWLGKVISSGTYGLMDNFEQVWNRNFENNKESIFEIQFANIGGSGTTARGTAFLPGINGGNNSYLATQTAVNAFSADDPRLKFSIFRNGDPFAPDQTTPSLNLDKYNPIWSSTGYSIRKGMMPIQYLNPGGGNQPVIRYADVLLMYAEAANELNMLDKARDMVNLVRQRPTVNMPVLTAATTGTKSLVLDAIVRERRVELMFEQARYNDLRRWGLAEKELAFLGYTARYRYYPLPQLEIDINSKLVQNTGW